MKAIFRKGSLGATGSVAYMFDHVGLVVASHPDSAQDAEEAAIDAGAQDVKKSESEYEFICSKPDLIAVTKSLQERGWQVSSSEFIYLVKDPVDLSNEEKPEVESFLNELDDNDDVHRIFTALK
jgi:transcriptional/translational regulatory protein YebC/TACO1